METLVKADIFFFISSIALVVLSLLGVVILVLLIKILRDVSHVSSLTRREVEELVRDFGEMRADVTSSVRATSRATRSFVTSVGVQQALSFLTSTLTEAMRQKRSRTRRAEGEEETYDQE